MGSILGLALLAIVPSVSGTIFEAESGTLAGGVYVATDLAGFTGTGYVTNFTDTGAALTISVTGLTAGSYDISIVYNAQYGDKYTSVSVNGASTVEASLANSTTETWATSLVGSFELTADTNTVELENDWGWYLIDSITVYPTPVKPIVAVNVTSGAIAQAEDGILNGTTVDTATTGYSGTGYVTGFFATVDSVTITLFSEVEALYDVVITYAAIYGGKQTTMTLNGAGGAEVVFADTSTATSPWANATAGEILLNAGNNTLTFTDDWGWYFIDCLYVTPAPAPAPHQVEKFLVAPDPLPVTLALYNTLLAKYGSGIIFSGQADPTGVAWLEANIGKTPAIIGLDMIDYSPTRVKYGANSTAVPDAIAFDARGGIIAFQWHWNAPADLINNDTVPWWDGIYTYGTTFNLTAALANTSSTDYGLLLSDMDTIAKELLILQAANIPVIWRPLHEADGGWFWWGAWGPDSCKTLYRLMFDRYTKVHKLRNLIWLWNSVTPSWYPGADVVDILGYDSYPAIGDHGPVDTQYQELIALGNDTKMVTLPEVGNIPDPSILKLYHADWSYFVTWDDDYIETDTYNSLAFKEQVYNDPTVLKLTDLGNWKGTATATSSKTSSTLSSGSKTSSTSKTSTSTSSKSSSTSKSSTVSSSSKSTSTTKTSTSTSAAPAATQSHYGQCGGTGWTGPTVCATGTTCTSVSPPWYYQCL